MAPKSDQFSICEVEWDLDAKDKWFNTILPKARLFYLHGILPKLALGSLNTMPPATLNTALEDCTPSQSTQHAGYDEDKNIEEATVVLSLSFEQKRVSSASGQRVLVLAGAYARQEGTVNKVMATISSVEISGVSVRVATKRLHAVDAEKVDRNITVAPRDEKYMVPVAEVKSWLKKYQMEKGIDLKLVRTNDTCSWTYFDAKLAEAQQLAKAKGTEELEIDGVEALVSFKNTKISKNIFL